MLAAAGAAAPSLDLGTGVLALQLRTPMLVAMAGATLQALHPERDVLLGIGISSPVVTRALARRARTATGRSPSVREYVTLVRECLARRVGRLRRRLLRRAAVPARRAAGRAPAEGRDRRAEPGDARAGRRGRRRRAAQLPAGVARAVVGRAGARSREGRAGGHRDLRVRPRRRVRAGGRHRRWPGATCSPTRSSTPTPATSSGPASATRSPRSASQHAAGDREGALGRGERPHGRRHRRHGRRRPRAGDVQAYVDAGVDVPDRSCRCRGAPTAGASSRPPCGRRRAERPT